MQLHVTSTSPYARMTRIAVIEKALEGRVTVQLAQTRQTGSPYYEINPSGRVPCLVRDDGSRFEDSTLICAYLDRIGAGPQLVWPLDTDDWEYGRLETRARSFLDGLAVWSRELRRPEGERSPGIIAHEAARADRMCDAWEGEIGHPVMTGPLNLPQITLACALGLALRLEDMQPYDGRPKLEAWADAIGRRPSLARTQPHLPLD
jgi:glutathione S-transferase